MGPVVFLALDIETMNPAPELAARIVEEGLADWLPPANVTRAETIAQRREAERLRLTDRLGLHDAAPVACAVLATPAELRAYHAFDTQLVIDGVDVHGAPDESAMLQTLADDLAELVVPSTVLVGHNLRDFDLPRLRLRMLSHGIAPASCLKLNAVNPVFDSMKAWRHFSVADKARSGYVPLDQVARMLGIPSPKGAGIDGAMVPGLVDAGAFEDVLQYCTADALVTRAIYLRLVPWLSLVV